MANKHTLVISTVDENNNINQKSITNINPLATAGQLKIFAEGLAALSDDTYVSAATVTRQEVTTANRPRLPLKIKISKTYETEPDMSTAVDIADALSIDGILSGSDVTRSVANHVIDGVNCLLYGATLKISKNNTSLVGDGTNHFDANTIFLRLPVRKFLTPVFSAWSWTVDLDTTKYEGDFSANFKEMAQLTSNNPANFADPSVDVWWASLMPKLQVAKLNTKIFPGKYVQPLGRDLSFIDNNEYEQTMLRVYIDRSSEVS